MRPSLVIQQYCGGGTTPKDDGGVGAAAVCLRSPAKPSMTIVPRPLVAS